MSAADPYGLLGVDPGATDAEIRRAFRRLARRAHPDAGGDPAGFVALRDAHDLLTDPVARARLDANRQQAATDSVGPTVGATVGDTPASAPGDDADERVAAALRSQWPVLEVTWQRTVGSAVPLDGDVATVTADGDRPSVPPTVEVIDAADGVRRWRAGLHAPAVAAPVRLDGLVVIASSDGIVHGLDLRDGTTRWERRLMGVPTGVLVHEGVAVVWSPEALTAIGPTGDVRWVVRPHGGVDVVVGAGAVVAVRTGAGTVVGVDPRTGGTRWWLRAPSPRAHPPLAAGPWLWLPDGAGGTGGGTSRLVGVDPRTGGAVHALGFPAAVTSLHEVGELLVVGDADRGLTAVRRGRPLWRMVMPATPSAPVGIDGAVAVATADGVLRFLSCGHGTELHRVPLSLAAGGPASLVLVGASVLVNGVAGGVVAHRAVRP